MPTRAPGPHPHCRSGAYMVTPAHIMVAAWAEARPAGIGNAIARAKRSES